MLVAVNPRGIILVFQILFEIRILIPSLHRCRRHHSHPLLSFR